MSDKKNGISRRSFLKAAGGVTIAAGMGIHMPAHAKKPGAYATLIDLSLCDGCPHLDTPACVSSCRAKNIERIPGPVDPIPDPFPRGKIEDWSKDKDVVGRLTPYNWLFIQTAQVEQDGVKKTVHVPRRCMHCDNPACATICPFAANHKHATGAVVIDKDLCFGGAKCRTVCPWDIPQRQSGVGIYLDITPTLAGNGVMFKCDLCQDRLLQGKNPACVDACPQKAMLTGPREEIYKEAQRRAEEMNGSLYGEEENGGTSTLYVSPIPFDELNAAIEQGPGKPHLKPVTSKMAETAAFGNSVLLAPLVGLAAGIAAVKGASSKNRGEEKEKQENE